MKFKTKIFAVMLAISLVAIFVLKACSSDFVQAPSNAEFLGCTAAFSSTDVQPSFDVVTAIQTIVGVPNSVPVGGELQDGLPLDHIVVEVLTSNGTISDHFTGASLQTPFFTQSDAGGRVLIDSHCPAPLTGTIKCIITFRLGTLADSQPCTTEISVTTLSASTGP